MTPLEHELRALAAEIEWPPTPNLATAVRARLEEEERRPAAPSRRWLRVGLPRSPLAVAAVVLLALLVAVALVPPARSAILRVLGLTHGARIVRVEPPPPSQVPRVSSSRLDLGRDMPLAAARRRLDFTPQLPSALGPPDRTRYSASIAGGAITFSWPGWSLTEIQGSGLPFVQKMVGPRTKVRPLTIAGARAYFLSGAPHQVIFADRMGAPLPGERAMVHGNVLLWDVGALSFRLETRHGLADALAVARSLRPAAG